MCGVPMHERSMPGAADAIGSVALDSGAPMLLGARMPRRALILQWASAGPDLSSLGPIHSVVKVIPRLFQRSTRLGGQEAKAHWITYQQLFQSVEAFEMARMDVVDFVTSLVPCMNAHQCFG